MIVQLCSTNCACADLSQSDLVRLRNDISCHVGASSKQLAAIWATAYDMYAVIEFITVYATAQIVNADTLHCDTLHITARKGNTQHICALRQGVQEQ